MAKVVVKSKVKKVKRKFPIEIKTPEFLGSKTLGKSEVSDLNSLVGRTSKVNLMYVTGNVRNQNVRLKFKIVEVSSGVAHTQVSEYLQIPYYLGRFVKKGSDLIEDSFSCVSKDGISFIVKPFIVTKGNTSELVLSSIRAKAKEVILKDAASKTYEDFISAVIFGKVQNVYRNDVKGIYPLKTFEFKKIELE